MRSDLARAEGEPFYCTRCQTYSLTSHCERCALGRLKGWRRKYQPRYPGPAQKPGDSEVRVVRAAYRDR